MVARSMVKCEIHKGRSCSDMIFTVCQLTEEVI